MSEIEYTLPEEIRELVDHLEEKIERHHKKCLEGLEQLSASHRYSEHQTRRQYFLDSTEYIRAQIGEIYNRFGRYSFKIGESTNG